MAKIGNPVPSRQFVESTIGRVFQLYTNKKYLKI